MGNTAIVIITISIILIIALINKVTNNSKYNENNDDKVNDNSVDMNEDFINNSKGHEIIPLVKVFCDSDKMIIRSILQSSQIRNYLELDNINSLYPGLQMNNLKEIIIFIYKDDVNDARTIIEDYIKNINNNKSQNNSNVIIDAISEIGNWSTRETRPIPELLV